MDLEKKIIKVHVAAFFNDGAEVPIMKMMMTIKELFANMFPQDPQILPLPSETPAEAPRCIFQKQDKTANLSFSLVRIDFDGSFKEGGPWKNHIEVIAYTFISLCITLGVGVKRLGVVVQALTDESIDKELSEKVSLQDFKNSDEKSMSWMRHDFEPNDLQVNINTALQVNRINPDFNGILTIDANTHVNSKLPQDIKKLSEVIDMLISKIEGKLHDVF